jgi:hypothetical protein
VSTRLTGVHGQFPIKFTRLCVAAVFLAGLGPGRAAPLAWGEYACAGPSGRIIFGLGFNLRADGAYADLGGKTSGRVVYSGSSLTFVGGPLAGRVGRDLRDDGFELGSVRCSVVSVD